VSEPSRSPTLMIVDDEAFVLASLKALFTLETNYTILEFTSPLAALDKLRLTPVDAILSDFLMPKMNGIELLTQARQIQPDTPRILLTGFADKENAIRAINEAGLYQYLEKPWDNGTLLMVLRNAMQERSLRQELEGRIRALNELVHEHTQLTHRHKELQMELEMAARVQRSLLPAEFPSLPGFRFDALYRPTIALGGDYYSAVCRDGAMIVLLGDVSGHGTQAALTTMLLKGIFEEEVSVAFSLTSLLEAMNRRLQRIVPPGIYAAAMVATLQPGNERVELASAGLPHPFVLRARGGCCDELPLTGLPLGLLEHADASSFGSGEAVLAPGDVLLLASDGLGSIRNPQGEHFEESGLSEALRDAAGLRGVDVIARLMQAALEFSEGRPLPDDTTLLAISREDAGS
jgi:phosphoserine phosphatase RsbU/P